MIACCVGFTVTTTQALCLVILCGDDDDTNTNTNTNNDKGYEEDKVLAIQHYVEQCGGGPCLKLT